MMLASSAVGVTGLSILIQYELIRTFALVRRDTGLTVPLQQIRTGRW